MDHRLSTVVLMVLAVTCVHLPSPAAGADDKTGGGSLADSTLQHDVAGNIRVLEMTVGQDCGSARVVRQEVVEPPARPTGVPWVELWTVDGCGKSVRYRVAFAPSRRGGTDFSVTVQDVGKLNAQVAPADAQQTSGSPSRWAKVADFGGAGFYVDFSSMVVDGSLRTVSEVRDLDVPTRSGARSFLCQNQYDCSERRYRALAFSSQSGQMGEGRTIQSIQPPGGWETDFTDDSPAGKIRRAVCERPTAESPQ